MVYTKPPQKVSEEVAKLERELANAKTFDLEQLNLLNLAKGLEETLNEKRPKTVLFKWWGNKKHKLDAEQQDWVLSQIQSAIMISDSLNTLKAKIFLSPEIVQNMINGYRNEAERAAELALEAHITTVYKLQAEREAIDRVKRREEAEIRLIEQKAILIDYIINSFKLDDLKPHHKTLLIQAMVNPQGHQYIDLETLEEIKQYAKMEAEGRGRSAIAKAGQDEAQTKIADKTAEHTVRTLDRIGNKPKGN